MKFRDYDNYEIYEDGRIYSYWTNKFLKPGTDEDGYKIVGIVDNNGKRKMYKVHRIVYETFTSKSIPPGMQVNHIDEDKTNNHINNLNLMTCKENINWGSANERRSKTLTNNKKRSKQVGAYKDGKLVITFQSTKEAGRQGFDQSAVSACCRGEKKTYKGYEWRYIKTKKET